MLTARITDRGRPERSNISCPDYFCYSPFQMSFRQENMVQWGLLPSCHPPRNVVEAFPGFCVADRSTTSPSPPLFRYSITVGPDKTLQWNPPIGSEELALALSYHFPLHEPLEAKMQAAIQKKYCDKRACNWAETSPELEQPKNAGQGNIFEQMKSPPKSEFNRLRHTKGDVGGNSPDTSQKVIVKSNVSPSKPNTYQPPQCNAGECYGDRPSGKPSAFHRPNIPIITWKADTGEVMISTGKKRPYTEDERRKVAVNRGNACDEHRHQKKKCDPMKCHQNKQQLYHGIWSDLALTDIAAAPLKTKSPRHPSYGPERAEGQGHHIPRTTYPQADNGCSNILHLITLPPASGGSRLDTPFQSIPEVEAAAGARRTSLNDLRPASQTTKSSSPPLSISTAATNRSSPDSSTVSLQIHGPDEVFDAADHNRSDPPPATQDLFPFYTTISPTSDALNIANSLIEVGNAPMSNRDSDNDAGMNQAGDYFLPFGDFLYFDPCLIALSNSESTSDKSRLPCQRKPSLDQSYMPSVNSTSSAEVYEEQKPRDEDVMPPPQIFKQPSTLRIERYGEGSFGGAVGGNNGVIKDYYSPSKPCYTRTLSGRSVHSTVAESLADGKESANNVMRANSVNSTTSQDSRYSTLHRGASAYRREAHMQGIFRRDSTNSATSQESQQNIHEREYRQVPHLDGSRKSDFQDTAKRSSAYDVDAFPSRRGTESDNIQAFSARGRKLHTFRYGHKGGRLPVQRNIQRGSDCTDQDQSMEQLTSVLDFTHI